MRQLLQLYKMKNDLSPEDLKLMLAKLAHLAVRDKDSLIALQSMIRQAENNNLFANVAFGNPEPESY